MMIVRPAKIASQLTGRALALATLATAATLVLAPAPALALQPAAEEIAAEPAAEPAPEPSAPAVTPESVLAALPFELHGFAEVIGRGDFTAGRFDFAIQQVELDVMKSWDDVVFFRLDLQYDAYYFDDATLTNFITSFVEQAVVDIQLYKPLALKIGFGRFNAPFGYEALDPLDRIIASYSQVFNYLDPFLLTGFRFTGAYAWFDWNIWVAQGWEYLIDNNSDKTFGWRLGFNPVSEFGFGIAGSYGSELPANAARRLSLSLDYSIKPVAGLVMGGEVTFRKEDASSTVNPGDDGMAIGFIYEGQYRFVPLFALGWRYDMIRDFEGIIYGADTLVHSVALAPTFYLFDHARIQLEYKGSFADTPLFSDAMAQTQSPAQLFQTFNTAGGGAPTDMYHTLTLQVIGYF